MNTLTGKASDAEIEREIKEWLKFASERDGARKERNDKKRKSITAAAADVE